jgi:uncharacterized protein (DUF1499 family)
LERNGGVEIKRTRRVGLMVCVISMLSCKGERPSNLGLSNGELAPCPSSANCVSSDAPDAAHKVEPFSVLGWPEAAWPTVLEGVQSLPRTTVVEESAGYLHAESASAVFGFVDDLELHLRVSEAVIAVRSASRVGRSDLGVNRRRVEKLRDALRARGVVR